jgi:hypothetical protein
MLVYYFFQIGWFPDTEDTPLQKYDTGGRVVVLSFLTRDIIFSFIGSTCHSKKVSCLVVEKNKFDTREFARGISFSYCSCRTDGHL